MPPKIQPVHCERPKKCYIVSFVKIRTGRALNPQENITAAIDIKELVFRFGPGLEPVLTIPSWRVEAKQRVFLQGNSGSGKSTLLGLLAGLRTPSSGSVSVLDTQISSLSGRKRDAFRAQHIGVVFQQFNLIPFLSVLDLSLIHI